MPKAGQKIEYCVPPLHVHDHTTQCVAHFLNSFRGNSIEHIKAVLHCGLQAPGGLVEEVEYWFQNCSDRRCRPGAGERVLEH